MLPLFSNPISLGGFSNWNNNAAIDNDANDFIATGSGIPTQLEIYCHSVTGVPTYNFYIRSTNTISGTVTYAQVLGVTLVSGLNTFAMTGLLPLVAGNTYYIWMCRTSNLSNYPSFDGNYVSSPFHEFRASAPNSDPVNNAQSFSCRMTISGLPPSSPGLLQFCS